MRRLALTLVIACTWYACRTTTSPKVPKEAIEQTADTKIPDAGAGDADASSER